jgi:hypothetical protein
MNLSYAITEELKGLNDDQKKSIYKIIKSLKKEKIKPKEEIPLQEIWQITSKSEGSWSKTVEDMREERI